MNAYKVVDLFAPFVGALTKHGHDIPVVYYHSIVSGKGESYAETNINVFKSHMKYLADNGYKTLRFNEIPDDCQKKKKEKTVIITFDDGYKNNFDMIFEFMSELGLKYNIFLIGSEVNSNPEFLNAEDIRKMSESGLVGFGAHTYSHIDSRTITIDNYEKEVVENNRIIKLLCGIEPTDFCFPYGYYNKATIDFFVKNCGYKRLYTSNYRRVEVSDGTIIRGRAPIMTSDSVKQFAHKLKGLYNFLYYIKYKKQER